MIPTDVHPEIHEFLERLAAADLPAIHSLEPDAAREQMEAGSRARLDTFPPPEVASVVDRTIPGLAGAIPVRVYRAPVDGGADALQPALLYFHGGGHVIGSLETHDTTARNLCREGECTVVSVDYRLGPEHRFPAAVDDCFAAVEWVAAHGAEIGVDPERIAVAGDSAGGNLAAVVSLMARDAGNAPAIRLQILIYPVTDYRCGDYSSYEQYAVGYGMLEADSMRWFQRNYLPPDLPAASSDWRASPLLAENHGGLPPALVITAECDVLRDEGVAYYERLRDAGTPCQHIDFPGAIHGFFGLLGYTVLATDAHRLAALALRSVLAAPLSSSDAA